LKIVAILIATSISLFTGIANAEELFVQSIVAKSPGERNVPYEEISPEDREIKRIWMGPNGDDTWWKREDATRTTWLAKFKNEAGNAVEISQWIDHYACSPTECPVVVFVDGTKVFDDRICTDRSSHNLTASANALFLCDRVIPLKAEAEE
jgi:hypothetical protein